MLEHLGYINEQHRKYVHVDIFNNNNNQRRGHELGGVGDTGGVAWLRGGDVNTQCRILKEIKKLN